jgi:hypothetical protein
LGWKLHLLSVSLIFAPLDEIARKDPNTSINKVMLRRVGLFCKGKFKDLFLESRNNAPSDAVGSSVCAPEDFLTTSRGEKVSLSAIRLANARGRDADVGKAAQVLASNPKISALDPLVAPQILKQFTPASDIVPMHACSVNFDDEDFVWSVGKVLVSGLEGSLTEIDALAWSVDHLPRRRAQDHMGWRYEHYQCLQLAVTEEFVRSFMRADVPMAARELLAGSRGFLVDKGDGKARAVCAVSALRRVAERCALLQDREIFAAFLVKAGQYGIGLPGGVEFVYHTNMLAMHAVLDEMEVHERHVVHDADVCSKSSSQPVSAQTDFANAFPSLHQQKIVEGLEQNEAFHPLVASARMIYSVQPQCFFVECGVVVMQQQILDGCHQGAPLAGVHFSVGTYPLALGLQSALRDVDAVCHWIMDDCSFAGDLSAVLVGFEYLKAHAPDYGLFIKDTKLKCWAPLMPFCVDDRPPQLCELIAHGFEVRRDGLKRVLGAPLSFRPALVQEWISDRVEIAASLMDRIPLLDDPQVGLLLLKFCGSTKLSFLTRMLSLQFLQPSLVENDASMKVCFEELLKCELSDVQWRQAKLPTRHGGCAISDPLLIAPAAELSSAVRVALLLSTREQTPVIKKMRGVLAKCPHLAIAKEAVDAAALDTGSSDPLCPSLESLVSADWPCQRQLSNVLHVSRLKEILREVSLVDRRHEAWIRSCARFGSGQWLHVLPQMKCFVADADEYRVMLCTRLLVPMARTAFAEMPRCACGEPHEAGFVSGNHWHSKCKSGKVLQCIMARHDAVRDDLASAGTEVGWHVEKELLGLYADSKGRPADVLFPPLKPGGRHRAVDVVVCDPRSVSSMLVNPDKVPLAAAGMKERKKLLDHQKKMATHGPGIVTFEKVPAAFESSGAWGKSMLEVWVGLKAAAKKAKLQNYVLSHREHTWSAFTFSQMIPQRISFNVAKWTARAVLRGMSASLLN